MNEFLTQKNSLSNNKKKMYETKNNEKYSNKSS